MDNKKGEWVNGIFQLEGIKEFHCFQKLNTSSQILSAGIIIKRIDSLTYFDLNPYGDDIRNLDDIRKSDMYFVAEKLNDKIVDYCENVS